MEEVEEDEYKDEEGGKGKHEGETDEYNLPLTQLIHP